MITTPAQIMINEALPEPLRKPFHELDGKAIKELMRQVAQQYPDKYADVVGKLNKLGHYAAQASGTSLSLKSATAPPEVKVGLQRLRQQVREVADSDLPDDQKNKKIVEMVGKTMPELETLLMTKGIADGNPLAMQASSGSRGNAVQFRQLVLGDGLVMDHRDNIIPVPILRGYASGLTPMEYFAGAYGARKGSVSTKLGTAQGGFLNKQLVMAAHRAVITQDDCGTRSGIRVSASDADNAGAVLAAGAGDYKPGTILDPKALKALGETEITVRSPLTCQAPEGICAKCAGTRDKGRLPDIGDNIGIPAAQAIGEKVSQGLLCLAEGTLVCIGGGEVRAIENIAPGDTVMGADKAGNEFPVKVLNRFDNGVRECVTTTFQRGDTRTRPLELISTPEHKVLCDGGQLLPVGEPCLDDDGEEIDFFAVAAWPGWVDSRLCKRIGQTPAGPLPTYDLEVDHPDHLFVLANGLIVSNSAKHSGGVVGASAPSRGGFKAINQLVQVPDSFQDGAALASLDGHVEKIEDAPQGGQYVTVGKTQHYVPPGQTVTVKPGQQMEAGDLLSDGVPNPAEIAGYKGLGEGRRAFMSAFKDALKASNVSVHRRNLEVLARSLVNHVRVTDPDGYEGFLPEDIVSYDEMRRVYRPREGAAPLPPSRAVGQYLEAPALHYTVGTRITPSVAKRLAEGGVAEVTSHSKPPPFEPLMVRAMESGLRDPNPLTRMQGSYLEKGLLESVHRGRSAKRHDTSFIPALVEGSQFGDQLSRTGKY